jgi:hypothetical protein
MSEAGQSSRHCRSGKSQHYARRHGPERRNRHKSQGVGFLRAGPGVSRPKSLSPRNHRPSQSGRYAGE